MLCPLRKRAWKDEGSFDCEVAWLKGSFEMTDEMSEIFHQPVTGGKKNLAIDFESEKFLSTKNHPSKGVIVEGNESHPPMTGGSLVSQKEAAPIVLRMGLSSVILWFGFNQIFNAPYWVGWLPSWHHHLMIAPSSLVISNGIFEVILGGLLLLGIFTRISAIILAAHILSIALNLGYTDVAIRDFGLAIMAVAVFLNGEDTACIGKKIKNIFSRKRLRTIL